jgi:hypothetical protein
VGLHYDPCSTLEPLVFTVIGATGSITVSGSGVFCDGLSPFGFPQFLSGTGQVAGGTGSSAGSPEARHSMASGLNAVPSLT